MFSVHFKAKQHPKHIQIMYKENLNASSGKRNFFRRKEKRILRLVSQILPSV